ncbi:MAG: hypothetical protein MJE12_13155 [Alphaproteobacteria bacterium]|nr:hypothetical protein [Alphaproteobacteria bacterium]
MTRKRDTKLTRRDALTAITALPAALASSGLVACAADAPRKPHRRVTIAELMTDAGSRGETRTIADSKYPSANGSVTWVSSDPLSGSDPGGKARYWARYPDGSGGFWQRDDWTALASPLDADNRINLDWVGLDNGEDITAVIQELFNQYIDGDEGNALYMEGLESVSDVIIQRAAITGDGRASKLYWYSPKTNNCTIRSKPYPRGVTDLMKATWTEHRPNVWKARVKGPVARLRIRDGVDLVPRNRNPMGSDGPFWIDKKGPKRRISDVKRLPNWHFDGKEIFLFAKSNPSQRYAGIEYFTADDALDTFLKLTNIHDIYVEGGTDYHNRGNGLHFAGRHGRVPAGGRNLHRQGDNGAAIFIEYNRRFVTRRSKLEWRAGISGCYSRGLHIKRTGTGKVETFKIAGFHFNQIETGNGAIGHMIYNRVACIQEYFRQWSRQVSASGVRYGGATNQAHPLLTQPFGFAPSKNIDKVTGEGEGAGLLPFVNAKNGGTQLGNGPSDRLKITYRAEPYIKSKNPAYTPNGRYVYYDDENSATPAAGKMDGLNTNRLSTAFLHLHFAGLVDENGVLQRVDIRDAAKGDILNVLADPETVDTGQRNAITFFEATSESLGWVQGNDNIDTLMTGPGNGVFVCSVFDPRTGADFCGIHKLRGDGTPFRMTLSNLCDTTEVHDFVHARRETSHRDTDIAIRINSNVNWIKPRDNLIVNNTLEVNRAIVVGNESSPGPFNTVIKGLITTGKKRAVIRVNAGRADRHMEGSPIMITCDNVDGLHAGASVEMIDGTSNANVAFSPDDGATIFRLPWRKDGVGNVQRGPVNSLVRLSNGHRPFKGKDGVNGPMPPRTKDGDLVIVMLVWDGDPGRVKPPSEGRGEAAWQEITGAAANTKNGDCYVKFFQKKYTKGLNCWDAVDFATKKGFRWSRRRTGHFTSFGFRGQHPTAPIGADVQIAVNETAVENPTAPTVATSGGESLTLNFIAMPGKVKCRGFGGSRSPWMTAARRHGKKFFGQTRGNISYAAADAYAGKAGPHAGCRFKVDGTRSIVGQIEIRAVDR